MREAIYSGCLLCSSLGTVHILFDHGNWLFFCKFRQYLGGKKKIAIPTKFLVSYVYSSYTLYLDILRSFSSVIYIATKDRFSWLAVSKNFINFVRNNLAEKY